MTEPFTIFAPFHCPIARSLAVIGDRWTILILRDLVRFGPRKFHDLERSLGGISPNTLSLRLKRLEETGVVDRRFYEQHPPRAEYVLTDVGRELRPVLKALFEWGERHTKYRAVTT
jgi:DNA-binding HxlR family transcriptional regulator